MGPYLGPDYLMVKYCADCKRFMGFARAAKACAGAISHGLCDLCVKKYEVDNA